MRCRCKFRYVLNFTTAHAVSLPQHGFLVYVRDRSNAEITHSTLIFTAVTQNHGDSRKSRHSSKITAEATVIVTRLHDYLKALINVTISAHAYVHYVLVQSLDAGITLIVLCLTPLPEEPPRISAYTLHF